MMVSTVSAEDLIDFPALAAEFEIEPDTIEGADFPAPVVTLSIGPIWDRRDVIAYAGI